MNEPMIRIPVKCPRCGGESLARFDIAVIAEAFILENPIRLHATCHDQWWDATYSERQEIRQRLVGLGLKSEATQYNSVSY